MISLTTLLGILENKKTVLRDLDAKIIEATQELGQLEEEICEIKEYHAVLTEKIAFLHDFITCSRPHPLIQLQFDHLHLQKAHQPQQYLDYTSVHHRAELSVLIFIPHIYFASIRE